MTDDKHEDKPPIETGRGDLISRDQIVGAVGAGARGLVQVIGTYRQRELSQVEVAQQAAARERQALADAVAANVQRLDKQEWERFSPNEAYRPTCPDLE